WVNKRELRVKVTWDAEENEPICLADILSCGARLEPYYADNRPHRPIPSIAEMPTLADIKTRLQICRTTHSSSPTAVGGGVGAADEDSIVFQYKRGGREYNIEWTHATSEAIYHSTPDYKAPFGMWQNVALPWHFIEKKMFGPDSFLNQRLSGRDASPYHRKTSIVKQMWQEELEPVEERILTPSYGAVRHLGEPLRKVNPPAGYAAFGERK
ncbi:MAG: hypothetical protein SGPRY_010125, partial [Prymnesium sp.]